MRKPGSSILHNLLLVTTGIVASTVIASTAAIAGGGPTGGSVVVGSATIVNASPTQTVVNQSSNKALINWNSFSIPYGSSVQFNQPTSKSLTVNRVTGPNASAIDGQLLANGNIWLINANGILFGKTSQLNVGALIATTSDISDSDFKNGKYRFQSSSNPNAAVDNKGTIVVGPGGSVVLSAPQVANEGLIQANLGTVVLGGAKAFTVDLDGDNLLRYEVTAPVTSAPTAANGSVAAALVSNSGTIEAAGGHVIMTARAAKSVQDNVINNSGMVEATTVSSHNGEIDLDAGPNGTVNDSGTLDASGTAQGTTGGAVNITGNTVNVADGAKIDASGSAGGGIVQIGGGLHGQGSLAHAQTTTVGNATIVADATDKGNGGTVVLWSDGNTNFSGSISAKGGAQGGNGGQVETSGHTLGVADNAHVSTLAPLGLNGDWLLDPNTITISVNGTLTIDTNTTGGATVSAGSIISALGSGNVTLEAAVSGNASAAIDINADIIYSSNNTLSLLSEGDITANASIQNSGSGSINVIAGWDGSTVSFSPQMSSSVYGQNAGNFVISTCGTNIAIGSLGGQTIVAGNNVDLTANGGDAQIGYHGAGGGGDIAVLALGNLTLSGGANYSDAAMIGNGVADQTVAGNVTGDIYVSVGGTTTIDQTLGAVYLGNIAAQNLTVGNATVSYEEMGNVTLITNGYDLSGDYLTNDLGLNSGAGGNIFLGFTATNGTIQWQLGDYTTPNTFTIASAANLEITGDIANSGAGGVNVIAGWDGHTTDLAAFTSTDVANATAYGLNNGSVTIDNAAVGSAGGKTAVAGYDITVNANVGNSQIGYWGTGGGDIDALAKDAVNVLGGGSGGGFAQIGNGGNYGQGSTNSTGNITVIALNGAVELTGGDHSNYAQIGNGGANLTGSAAGNITVFAGASVGLSGGADVSSSNAYAQIGNGGYGFNGTTNGSVSVQTNGSASLTSGDGRSYAQIGNGGDSSTHFNAGDVTVVAGGNVSLIGEADYAQIGNGGYSSARSIGNISVAAGGNLILDDSSGLYGVQIGKGGVNAHGSDSGNIAVSVGGNLDLTGGQNAAQIGNGDYVGFNGNVSGNIGVAIGGSTAFDTLLGTVWIGDYTSNGTERGDLSLITGAFDFSNDIGDAIGHFAGADILGGNVTIGTTNASYSNKIDKGISYTSQYSLTYLSAGNLTVSGSFQNSGTGNITLVVGWDPSVAPANVSTTAGAYGNNNAVLLIGGPNATADAAVGSQGGATTILTDLLTVDSENGYAQIGYHGTGGGNITAKALDGIQIIANDSGAAAQIGNGGTDVIGNITGNISVTTKLGGIAVAAHADHAIAAIGNFGGTNSSESGNIAIDTNGSQLSMLVDNPGTSGRSLSYIGNFTDGDTTGTSSGDIMINAGAMSLAATGGKSSVEIGDGTFYTGNDTGALSGNITINATTLTVAAEDGNPAIKNYARIGNLGNGTVTGDVSVTTTGDIEILSDYAGVSGIGGVSAPSDVHGKFLQGQGSGNTTVQSGGNITLTAENGGNARIQSGGFTSGNINVTAAGNISLLASSGAGGSAGANALIGAIMAGNGTVNVTVISDNGAINLEADDPNSTAQIGNLENNASGAVGGNIAVSANNSSNGGIFVNAVGSNAIAQIGNSDFGATGSVSGDVSLTSGGNITVETNGTGAIATIGNAGGVGTSESGDIALVAAQNILANSANLNSTVRIGNSGPSDVTGNITVTADGSFDLEEAAAGGAIIGDTVTGAFSGNVLVTAQSVAGMRESIANDLMGGNFTLNSLGNSTITIDNGANYSSSYDLTVNTGGSILVEASLQNSGSGAITLVSAQNITIGGAGALGDVAVGSRSGVTTIAANNLILAATDGYAQLGYHGGGSGPIIAAIAGNVTLNGGSSADFYAQIGDGGYKVSGSSDAPISVNAGGDIALNGGSGQEAYVQIGNGGAESNSNSSGYSETGLVTVTGQSVELGAGTGQGSYVQIGHGGYRSGQSLNGIATIGGDIAVNAVTGIQLNGNGADAYAQIGNGGDFVNDQSANGSGGTIFGNITATVSSPSGLGDPVTLTGGSGANSYAQIGNGGQGENTPISGAAVTLTVSDDVLVSDLTLTGGSGTNAYAQVGNGDGSQTGTGNISGNITFVGSPKLTATNGTGKGANAAFGNATGFGTVSGTVANIGGTGDAGASGSVAAITHLAIDPTSGYFGILTLGSEPGDFGSDTGTQTEGPTPLDQLSGSSGVEGVGPADSVAQSIGKSLNGGNTIYVSSRSVIPGMLTQYITLYGGNPHGVPPADEDYSSWGNEALWRW